ncbi:hypothetical protein [Conexibacter arvalis]|uniref:Uncharacterized protein n=1 Tax=Conexibacter arvalis TaxID=912552 RepID=A0A840IJ68_9ACTN|nr:hypothetical protein [Conexibacter arvalis]MBB4665137.1 hypothetical protein [Conexibacter arvalis]
MGQVEERRAPFELLAAHTAEQPSWRLHRAHPAIGLVAAESADASPPAGDELRDFGLRWLSLPDAEQRLREQDMTRALLRRAAHGDDARFELAERWAPGATRSALRTLPEVSWDETGDCTGPLTDDVIEVLARRPSGDLVVVSDDRLFLIEEGYGPARSDLCVWLDPWRADELRAELEDAWWPAAQARADERRANGPPAPRDGGRVSRDARAAIVHAWERRGSQLALAGFVALASSLLADTWLNMLVVFVVVMTVLFWTSARLERWYRRS